MHNNSIEARTVFPQPFQQGGTEPSLAAGAQGVDRKRKIAEERSGGVVQGGKLAGVSGRSIADEHPDDFSRAARYGADGADDVEDSHSLKGRVLEGKDTKRGGVGNAAGW